MSSESISELIAAVRREADEAEFPIDEPVYQRAGRDPKDPILFAGTLAAPLCVVGRDLGKDEVAAGQPLIGAAGRLVRRGVLAAWEDPAGAGDSSVGRPPIPEGPRPCPADQHGPLQAAGQQGLRRVGPPPVPPVRRAIARRPLEGSTPHHSRHRGVPVVRAVRRPRRPGCSGKVGHPVRVGLPLPAAPPGSGTRRRQGDHRVSTAAPLAPQPPMVRQVSRHARRPTRRSPQRN